MKIKKKFILMLSLIMISLLGLLNSVNADVPETYTYGNFNYQLVEGDTETYAVITSLVDNTVEELRIPATINGYKVNSFEYPIYIEENVYSHILSDAKNLKKLIIEDANFGLGISEDRKDLIANCSVQEIIFEQKKFPVYSGLGGSYKYFNTNVKFYGYGHTRLQDSIESSGYTYESIGENTETYFLNEEKTKLEYLNCYTENLIVPETVTNVSFIVRNIRNVAETFSVESPVSIKTIRFETKGQIKIIDQDLLTSVETVYGYEGTGAEIIAENLGATFISLGKLDPEVNLYTYEIVNNEYVSITGFNRVYPMTIEFPETIENLPVRVIKGGTIPPEGWLGTAEVYNITIPSTVRTIEAAAFDGTLALKTLTIKSKEIEYLDDFTGTSAGYSNIMCYPTIYAYDESGIKNQIPTVLAENYYVSLNDLEYTTKDTEDVTIEEGESTETVTVMPVEKETGIEDFLTAENFPIIGTYTVEVYDASGNLKETGNLGSRNIIKITDENGNILVEFTVIVPGDITGKGLSRMYDAFQILKDTIIPGTTLDAIDIKIRDYNNDGNVRMYDAFQFLKEAILGK